MAFSNLGRVTRQACRSEQQQGTSWNPLSIARIIDVLIVLTDERYKLSNSYPTLFGQVRYPVWQDSIYSQWYEDGRTPVRDCTSFWMRSTPECCHWPTVTRVTTFRILQNLSFVLCSGSTSQRCYVILGHFRLSRYSISWSLVDPCKQISKTSRVATRSLLMFLWGSFGFLLFDWFWILQWKIDLQRLTSHSGVVWHL